MTIFIRPSNMVSGLVHPKIIMSLTKLSNKPNKTDKKFTFFIALSKVDNLQVLLEWLLNLFIRNSPFGGKLTNSKTNSKLIGCSLKTFLTNFQTISTILTTCQLQNLEMELKSNGKMMEEISFLFSATTQMNPIYFKISHIWTKEKTCLELTFT